MHYAKHENYSWTWRGIINVPSRIDRANNAPWEAREESDNFSSYLIGKNESGASYMHRLCFTREKFFAGNFSFARAFRCLFFFPSLVGEMRRRARRETPRNRDDTWFSSLSPAIIYAGFMFVLSCDKNGEFIHRSSGLYPQEKWRNEIVFTMQSGCFNLSLIYVLPTFIYTSMYEYT